MPHIPESRIYYELLQQRCSELDLNSMIEFVPSPSEECKFALYRQCDSAIYTPPNEHFGIVPIEALEQRRPVIVIDSGGPSETVIEDRTGTKVWHFLYPSLSSTSYINSCHRVAAATIHLRNGDRNFYDH